MAPSDDATDAKIRAVALRYEHGIDEAPTVVARGEGLIADRIVALAREAGVPVESNPELAEALSLVEIGTAIPEDLYPVVAELLVFITRVNARRAAAKGGMP
ncbi:MAG: EscU/YscU/HrcU family type III secretion system export apparatus switch protein [Candidatus Sericytochromatia bacterium]|nr:EscU/YscU/HrcU family type III secretion system export apparatus switch protein [Candidatus Sericytochromatia bacterium]